jgi:hypothetical protein
MTVRKIFITLTIMAFALTLAAAAPAQVVKTTRQPKLRNPQAAPAEAAPPAAKDKPKPGDQTPQAVKPGPRAKHQTKAPKRTKKAAKKGKGKKRTGAHMITVPETK